MDGKQLTGLVTFSARYFFNIDEHILSQIFMAFMLALLVGIQVVKSIVPAVTSIGNDIKAWWNNGQQHISFLNPLDLLKRLH